MKSTVDGLAEMEMVFASAAIDAGRAILEAIGERLTSSSKADGSPVTQADTRAEDVIRARLAQALPRVRIIGEEGGAATTGGTLAGAAILVDPLDGTRDCLAGSPEFTVNIAFVEDGRPVCGVLYAPALGRLQVGNLLRGAWQISVPPGGGGWESAPRAELRVRRVPPTGAIALESRSHREPATDALAARFDIGGRRTVGSSLKFGLIAAGEADIYVRAVRLNQWDIAAGDAVLTAAGGAVLTLAGEPVRYELGDTTFRAPPFVAVGDREQGRVLRLALGAQAGSPPP